MWMKKGYLYFVICCSLLEDCEILTNSPSNSSLLEQNELQHRQEHIDGESRSQSQRRIIVHKSHFLCPLKDIVNNPTTKKTTPLSSNKQASDGLGTYCFLNSIILRSNVLIVNLFRSKQKTIRTPGKYFIPALLFVLSFIFIFIYKPGFGYQACEFLFHVCNRISLFS